MILRWITFLHSTTWSRLYIKSLRLVYLVKLVLLYLWYLVAYCLWKLLDYYLFVCASCLSLVVVFCQYTVLPSWWINVYINNYIKVVVAYNIAVCVDARRPTRRTTTSALCRSERFTYSRVFNSCNSPSSAVSGLPLYRTSRCASQRYILSCCPSGQLLRDIIIVIFLQQT